MISKHRNRSIWQFACALAMTVVFFSLFAPVRGHIISENEKALLVLVYLATVTMWMVGCFSLAKAKGYATDMTGGIFLFLFLLGCCIPCAPFVFPVVVIFGLKDKTKRRSRWN